MEKQTHSALLAEARELFGVFGKNQRALDLVDQVLHDDAKYVEAMNLKAAILYDMDRDDEAWDYHTQALKLEPNSVEALHGIASIANERGNFAEGLQWTTRALRAIPNDPYQEFTENEDYRQRLIAEVYNEHAFALWYLEKTEEARRVLSDEAPQACPLEIESFEEQLDWLEHHLHSPEE